MAYRYAIAATLCIGIGSASAYDPKYKALDPSPLNKEDIGVLVEVFKDKNIPTSKFEPFAQGDDYRGARLLLNYLIGCHHKLPLEREQAQILDKKENTTLYGAMVALHAQQCAEIKKKVLDEVLVR